MLNTGVEIVITSPTPANPMETWFCDTKSEVLGSDLVSADHLQWGCQSTSTLSPFPWAAALWKQVNPSADVMRILETVSEDLVKWVLMNAFSSRDM